MDPKEVKELKKDRTSEQKKAIDYVCHETGCFGSPVVKDEEYDQMVMQKVKATDWKRKALNKLGLDEDQVSEVEPIHLEAFYFDEKSTYARYGKDKKWRSSHYQISWIFASNTHIYLWQYTFSMINDTKKERTEEYFYKDITNFSTSSETVEKETPETVGCLNNKIEWKRKNVDYNKFAVIVPGDKFLCSTEDSEYVEASVQGLKAKLREKKA